MRTRTSNEVDPRDDDAIAKLNAERTAQFVTVKDDVDLAVIPAFRLLAAKLQPWHPILLKDILNCREKRLCKIAMKRVEFPHETLSISRHTSRCIDQHRLVAL